MGSRKGYNLREMAVSLEHTLCNDGAKSELPLWHTVELLT